MKIQCDVCHKGEASFLCVADESALCESCDHTLHHAADHHRFSLLHPSLKQSPLCDICQETRAFLFCQQDRAILCRGCDVGIHKANEHTQKHNRFLLTGVKISATSTLHSSSSSPSSSSASCCLTDGKRSTINFKPVTVSHVPLGVVSPPNIQNPIPKTSSVSTNGDKGSGNNGQLMMNVLGNNGVSSSSVSEYLEMLPAGYHVDSSSPYGFYKIGDTDALPFWGIDLETNLCPEITKAIRVPHNPPPLLHSTQAQNLPSATVTYAGQVGFKNSMEVITNTKDTRKWRYDNSFAVPQMISTSPSTFKKSRTLY